MLDAALTPTSWGATWHVACPPALTQRAMLDTVGAAAGSKAKPSVAPTPVLRVVGTVVPVVRELAEIAYQWAEPYRFGAQTRIGTGAPTPHPEAVERTVRWFRDNPPA